MFYKISFLFCIPKNGDWSISSNTPEFSRVREEIDQSLNYRLNIQTNPEIEAGQIHANFFSMFEIHERFPELRNKHF